MCGHRRRVFPAKVHAMPSSHSHLERSPGTKHIKHETTRKEEKGMYTSECSKHDMSSITQDD